MKLLSILLIHYVFSWYSLLQKLMVLALQQVSRLLPIIDCATLVILKISHAKAFKMLEVLILTGWSRASPPIWTDKLVSI